MRKRWMVWLLVLGGWTILAVVFAVSSSIAFALSYQPPRWRDTLAIAATEWLPWAALTPLVYGLASRFDLRLRRRIRRVIVLGVLGWPVAVAKLSATRSIRDTTIGNDAFQPSHLATQYLIYWGIIAAAYGLLYFRDAQARALRASQLEGVLARTRLQLLNMQLQPHFLFNTLNAIAELIRQQPDQAERMIEDLGHLLRHTLSAGLADRVPLEEELALLRRYVDIQQTRFGDRLKFAVIEHDDARRVLVPNLLLQPLVENAIRHGLAERRDAGTIEIHIRKLSGRLALDVLDDGVGVSTIAREGIGLSNTRLRLEAIYGSDATLTIAPRDTAGTIVQISVPWQVMT